MKSAAVLAALAAGALLAGCGTTEPGAGGGAKAVTTASASEEPAAAADKSATTRASGAVGAPAAGASSQPQGRLQGSYRVRQVVTQVPTVLQGSGNRRGDASRRIWTFQPDCATGPCSGRYTSVDPSGISVKVTGTYAWSDGSYVMERISTAPCGSGNWTVSNRTVVEKVDVAANGVITGFSGTDQVTFEPEAGSSCQPGIGSLSFTGQR